MVTEERLNTLLADANPVPDVSDIDLIEVGATTYLATLEQRSSEVTQLDTKSKDQKAEKTVRQRWLVAAVVVVLAGVALLLVNQSGQTEVADQPFGPDSALDVSNAYIEASNTGDTDAVLALFTTDVALSEKYTGMSASFDAIDRGFFEQHLAWAAAQGTTFTSPECAVTEQGPAAAVTVVCEFGWLYPAEQAIDAPPVPTTLTMIVTPEGISQMAFEYPPDFGVGAFENWLLVNHMGELEGVEYGDWNSVAEAEAGGKLRAQYVDEWAASLETNG